MTKVSCRRGSPPLPRGIIQNGEVVPLVEIRDEPRLGGPPAEPLLGQRAGRRRVELREQRERAGEVTGCLLGPDGDNAL